MEQARILLLNSHGNELLQIPSELGQMHNLNSDVFNRNPNFIFRNNLRKTHLNVEKYKYALTKSEVSSSEVNVYFPINFPELLRVLLPYLKYHDVFKLLRLCKGINLAYFGELREVHGSIEENVLNAMEHNCTHCVENLVLTNNSQLFDVFKIGCKYGYVESINILSVKFSNIKRYDVDNKKKELFTNELFVNECVRYAFAHDISITVLLLGCITKYFKIENVDILNMICQLENEHIIKNICNLGISNEVSKVMLPFAWKYNIVNLITECLDIFTYDNDYLVELIKNNVDSDNTHIITLLLGKLFKSQTLNGLQLKENDIVIFKQLADKIIDKSVLLKIINNDSDNRDIIYNAYKLGVSQSLYFLNDTKELNMLSIQEAIKYNGGAVFTGCLTTRELVNLIIGTTNVNVRTQLISKLSNYDTFCDLENEMKIIIGWVIMDNNPKIIEHLFELKNLDVKLKGLFLHKLGHKPDHYLSSVLRFHGLVTLIATIPNNETRNKLTNLLYLFVEDMGQYDDEFIEKYDTNKKVLPVNYDQVNYDCVDSPYALTFNMVIDKRILELNGVKFLLEFDAGKQSFMRKIKISKKILDLYHTKLILESDDTHYYEILKKLLKVMQSGIHKSSCKHVCGIINFLVDNQKFNDVKPSSVFKLIYHLKSMNGYEPLEDIIISKHNFFRQLREI
jgi:hypothetical protein